MKLKYQSSEKMLLYIWNKLIMSLSFVCHYYGFMEAEYTFMSLDTI